MTNRFLDFWVAWVTDMEYHPILKRSIIACIENGWTNREISNGLKVKLSYVEELRDQGCIVVKHKRPGRKPHGETKYLNESLPPIGKCYDDEVAYGEMEAAEVAWNQLMNDKNVFQDSEKAKRPEKKSKPNIEIGQANCSILCDIG